MKNKNIIKIKNLSKTFYPRTKHKLRDVVLRKGNLNNNRFIALENINLNIKKGEFLGIIGPNGAGKSTLLKMISNIYLPTSGDIQVRGSVSPFLELRAGFQRELSAKDNLYLYGAYLGMHRTKINKLYKNIVSFADMEYQMNKYFKDLSSGNKMRLGFSITVHSDTDIFLIDEALSVGDELFQKKAIKKMLSLNKKGKTIILVSHDLDQIKSACSRVVLIDKGKIINSGNPNTIINTYKNINGQLT